MLIELSIILGTYAGVRSIERWNKRKIREKKLTQKGKNVVVNHPEKNLPTLSAKKDLKIAYFGLGVSVLQPIFLPNFSLINAFLLSYSNYPCLKGSEEAFKSKKINNEVLGAVWTVFAVGSGQYFAAALGIVVYHIGSNFIEKTRNHSQEALVNIFDRQDRKIWVLQEGTEIEISLENVLINDIVIVNSAEMIPVDGEIISGLARIDEHILTGESQTIEKSHGEMVFASTLLISGTIHIQVKKAGNDTTVAKIEKVLNQTTNFKSSLQLKGEAWADKSAPYFLSIAGLTALTFGFTPAAAVLSAQFGYQIRMVVPLSTLRHLSQATNAGILIKDGRSLERLNEIDTILFDKTGTLTEEQPQVGQVISWGNYTSEDILRFAATAEVKLKHPIAKAILDAYAHYNKVLDEIDDAHYEMGFGTKVHLKQKIIRVGSLRFMQNEGLPWNEERQNLLEPIYQQGHSIVMVAVNNDIVGVIEIKPTIRNEIPELIHDLKQRGIKNLIIVSGDHQKPTQQLAEKLGMADFFAEVLPEGKSEIVQTLQKRGHKVCFIGDGINDTIAMKQADVSISLQGASTIATDTADIVLMNGKLESLTQLFNIANNLDNIMKKSTMMVVMPAAIILLGSVAFQVSLLAAVIIKQSFLGTNILYVLKHSRANSTNKKIKKNN